MAPTCRPTQQASETGFENRSMVAFHHETCLNLCWAERRLYTYCRCYQTGGKQRGTANHLALRMSRGPQRMPGNATCHATTQPELSSEKTTRSANCRLERGPKKEGTDTATTASNWVLEYCFDDVGVGKRPDSANLSQQYSRRSQPIASMVSI